MNVRDLGTAEYSSALKEQEAIRDQIIDHTATDTLIVCEHPEVITIGRALGAKNEISDSSLPQFEISRGGRATLHLPGQIVVYPIIDLNKRTKDLHLFMRTLEDAIIDTLEDFRIHAGRIEGKTGVWIDGKRKIASIGIGAKNWVTYHGLALNVCCDLKLFSHLQPCGFDPHVMTSVENEMDDAYKKVWKLNRKSLLERVKKRLIENLQERLE